MARIKIAIPKDFSFSARIPIRITDLNYGSHVGNDTFLSLLHEARVQFLAHCGLTELQFETASLIMADVAIEFKAELYYGDTVQAFVAAGDFSRVGFDLYYRMVKEGTDSVVALAKTGMVTFDYDAKKVVSVPAAAVLKMQNARIGLPS